MSKTEGKEIARVQLISICLIGSVALLEITAGILTNSLAVLGDGFHALYDFIVSGMLLLTYRISLKPADESHTYGHSRIKTLGSFTSGVAFLYLVIQLFLRSIDKIMNPSQVYLGLVGFVALAYTLAVDAVRITLLSRPSGRRELSVKAGFLHAIADFFDTIIAVSGFLLAGYFSITYADAAAGLLLSMMMTYLGVKLLYETGLELTDTVPPLLVKRIREAVEKEYGMGGVSYLNVRRVDRKTYVDIGALVPVESNISSIHRSVENVEENIAKAVGGEVVVRVQTMPRDSGNLYDLIKDSALRSRGVLNVHDILVSMVDDKLFASLHIEVPSDMRLSDAHRIADEVEENVLKNVENVGNVMVHVETAGSSVIPVKTIGSNSSLYLKVKGAVENEVKQFHNIKDVKKIIVFRETSGLNRIELTVSMEGGRSMSEAHEAASRLEHDLKRITGGSVEVVVHVEPEKTGQYF